MSEHLLPQLQAIQIPVEEGFIAARIFSPKGKGPFPTVLLLHGFPGVQNNFDLAAQLQNVGYQVVVFHYRGVWGSRGNYSFVHALEDVDTVLAYLRRSEMAAKYQIELKRIAIVGHSFGGFLALQTGAYDNDIAAIASLSGVNLALVAHIIGQDRAQVEALFEQPASFTTGYSSRMFVNEVLEHASEWNLIDLVPKLSSRPVLLVGAEHDELTTVKVNHEPLVEALQSEDATQMQSLVIESTGHGYDGKRDLLFKVLSDWLSSVL